MNAKTETGPAGVETSWDQVLLGVGVTVTKAFFEGVPPNVATKLSTKRSKSASAT